ncbi:MAG: glyoxalase [Flavobacteriaceae bacterium]|nr:glyoxalase [Flavobacteriaceae bacterium]
MIFRDQFIKEFRGETIGLFNSETSSEELFQNQMLRPILKLQNDIFFEIFNNYILKSKANFETFTIDKKLQFIESSIQNDMKFRSLLIGIVIGLFTIDEYLFYSNNSTNLNKRIITMLIERIKSQLQLL